MSFVEIRDHALWAKHIHGNKALKQRIIGMAEGGRIHLEIDGKKGEWVKMDDGKDGRPTPGLKGMGDAREHWHALQSRRGELVSIREVE